MSFKRSIVSLGFLAIALAAPAARAQTCKVDTDCTKGFSCVLVPSSPPSEPTSPPPACKPGTICPVTDPAPTAKVAIPVPTPDPTGYCQEASCKADTDCGTGMVCHTETYSACSGGSAPACPANTNCIAAKPAPTVCTETKVSTCMFKWQLPCNVASDCGDGFDCKATVSGSCSGSSGTGVATPGTTTNAGGSAPSTGGAPAPAAAVAPVVPPDNCTTTSSFPGYCAPKATTCAVDTDCPALWFCAAAPPTRTNDPGVAVGSPTVGTGGAAGAADVAVPTSGGATLPAPVTTRSCVSPFGGGYAVDVGGTMTTNGGSGGTTATIPPKAGGTAGASGNATGSPAESAQPAAGCAVGGSSSGSPFAALLLGALGLLVARRKR
jgi:MYXO-CTERM domain-containing protein